MIDFGTIFSQLWFLIPIFIVIEILKELTRKPKKKNYKNYQKNKYSETKKDSEITLSKIIDRLFPKVNETVKEFDKNFEDIKKHNKESINPKKDFEQNFKNSDEKYKKKHEEKIKTNEYEYFTNLKKESKEKENNDYKERKGKDLEIKTGKYYESLGYSVNYNGIEKGVNDGGIDLICTNSNEIILIQCKNWSWKKGADKITAIHIKSFHSDSMKYIEENHIDKNKVKLKYVIPNKYVFEKNVYYIFKDDYYKCKYEII